jgi:hypothetical protein
MNEFLATIAPTLASALLGPLGGVAVAGLGKIFGIEGATTAQVAKVFQDGKLTPDQLSAIKMLELKLQAEEKERGFRYSELQFKDTAGARAMQIATMSNVPPILAILVTTGFFGILIFMVTNSSYKPTEPLLVMLGSLGTAWTMIIGFYFGSSHGSQSKDRLLANSLPGTEKPSA